jgi:hypothetical protein
LLGMGYAFFLRVIIVVSDTRYIYILFSVKVSTNCR